MSTPETKMKSLKRDFKQKSVHKKYKDIEKQLLVVETFLKDNLLQVHYLKWAEAKAIEKPLPFIKPWLWRKYISKYFDKR